MNSSAPCTSRGSICDLYGVYASDYRCSGGTGAVDGVGFRVSFL